MLGMPECVDEDSRKGQGSSFAKEQTECISVPPVVLQEPFLQVHAQMRKVRCHAIPLAGGRTDERANGRSDGRTDGRTATIQI